MEPPGCPEGTKPSTGWGTWGHCLAPGSAKPELKLLLELQEGERSAWAVLQSTWSREREADRAVFGLEKGSRGQGHSHIALAARTWLFLAVLFAAGNKGIEISQG